MASFDSGGFSTDAFSAQAFDFGNAGDGDRGWLCTVPPDPEHIVRPDRQLFVVGIDRETVEVKP